MPTPAISGRQYRYGPALRKLFELIVSALTLVRIEGSFECGVGRSNFKIGRWPSCEQPAYSEPVVRREQTGRAGPILKFEHPTPVLKPAVPAALMRKGFPDV